VGRRTTVLKKIGIVVGLTTAGALLFSPLAFADDDCEYGGGNSHEGMFQDPSLLGNNSYYEGVYGFWQADQSHSASHDAECSQENESEISDSE
jgi:hypothetical protein